VRGHNGAFDASRPFTIEVKVTDVSCTGVTLTDDPLVGFNPVGTSRRTLILTNTAQFPLGSDTAGLKTKLGNFAGRSDIAGELVDLDTIAGVRSAYAIWNGAKDCPAAANIVARRIKDVITAYKAANPGLAYIVIAGSDRVVPFFRTPDQSGLGSEKDYRPAVLDPTASQASLRLGYVLTQDFYGSTRAVSRFDHELYLPDLAVGRLVESVSDIGAVIDAYPASGAVAPTRALVTGYDFLADTALYIEKQFTDGKLALVDRLIQPIGESHKGPNAWTASQLRAKLFGATTYGILSLNSHFSANSMLAADYATRLLSSEIAALPAADTRFLNALILSTGCHSGYNIVDGEATTLTQPIDWVQAFAARGATVIGGTGYQYGDTDFMKYSEKILGETALELRYGTGPVPIGVALANAKRTYLSSLSSLKGIDEKALAEATLYGLPMLGYDLPASGRLIRPTQGTIGALTPLTSDGLSYATLSPVYVLTEHHRPLTIVGGTVTTDAIYWDADGNVAVSPGSPVLPQTLNGVSAVGQSVRGALLQSATYSDEPGITPFTDVATTEVRGVHPRYVTDVFTPVRPFGLNHFSGSNLMTTPFQFRSTSGGTTGVGRRFTSESFRLYYSSLTDARALAAAPVVYTVTLSRSANPDLVDVDVVVGAQGTVGTLAAVGIEEVWATYTAETPSTDTLSRYGKWTSIKLSRYATTTKGPGIASRYSGSIPRGSTPVTDVRALIQAVGGNGLVTWASNDGAYYRVVDETATAAQPKVTTEISLTVPAGGTYLATLAVRARLTAVGAGLNGKAVSFRSGGIRVDATTATDLGTGQTGWAVAQLPLNSAPGTAQVTVGFAEDLVYLGSGDDKSTIVDKAAASFGAARLSPVSLGGTGLVATLSGAGRPLGGQLVMLTAAGRTTQTFTDGFGGVRLDTADGFPAGAYSLSIAYAGNDRFFDASLKTDVVVYDPNAFTAGVGTIITPPATVGLVTGKPVAFGFAAVYRPGATTPIGILEFYSRESGVLLSATSLDWLAVSAGRAEFQGHGRLNGYAGWSFRVVAIDGSPDRFEIRIWQDGVTTYDGPTYRTGNSLASGAVIARLLQPGERDLSPSDLRRLAER
jgi:hypothetical protein